MRGVMRPSRGRPNKVTKPSVPATPRGRVSGSLTSIPGQVQQHMSPPEHKPTEYPEGMISDLNAAAAAAAATAAMTAAGMNPGADVQDAEADADMEDDDQHTGLHPQQHDHTHTDHMDLNTAANILANGGNGALPSGTGLQLDDQQQRHLHQQQQMHVQAVQAHQQQQAQQQHHQQLPMGDPTPQLDVNNHGFDGTGLVKTTEQMARDSGYEIQKIDSALARRLSREPGLRLATQRRTDQRLNLERRSNVEALFAHIAGQMAPSQCKNCHKGHGPWTSCVVVDGQMCGSCANCWFNASGARCSFHEARNPQPIQNPGLLGTPGASLPPPEQAAAVYSLAQHGPGIHPHLALPSAGAAAPGNGTSLASLGMGSDPVVRYTVERAMLEVRNADRKTRQIMKIEIAAKQLALQILDYEETSAMAPNNHVNQQQQQHVAQQQQQGLGGGDPAS